MGVMFKSPSHSSFMFLKQGPVAQRRPASDSVSPSSTGQPRARPPSYIPDTLLFDTEYHLAVEGGLKLVILLPQLLR